MAGLRFTERTDGIHRAKISIDFIADPSHLGTAIIYKYQNDPPEEAVREIEQLSKSEISDLTKELFKQRGYEQEFIGEDCDQSIHDAAEARVEKLWPKIH